MRCIAIGRHLAGVATTVSNARNNGSQRRARTGRPQPTQSSNTVPSLFTPLMGVPAAAGVPASLDGVPCLELGSVFCDDDAAAAETTDMLEGVGGCTK